MRGIHVDRKLTVLESAAERGEERLRTFLRDEAVCTPRRLDGLDRQEHAQVEVVVRLDVRREGELARQRGARRLRSPRRLVLRLLPLDAGDDSRSKSDSEEAPGSGEQQAQAPVGPAHVRALLLARLPARVDELPLELVWLGRVL